jgi:sigma-B regulation protein RsbQ
VGAGRSDIGAYDPHKYDSLTGYAQDLNEIIDQFAIGPVIVVGHSVSAMIDVLADRQVLGRVAAHIMVDPSPCYVDTDDYVGGFTLEDIQSLLDSLDDNYLGWSSNMAPVVMGAPGQPELGAELTNSFCRTDPSDAEDGVRSVGLGLFIVREVAKAQGGRVSVSSDEKSGTSYTVSFPLG